MEADPHYRRLDDEEFLAEFRPEFDAHGGYRQLHPAVPHERETLLFAHAERRVWTLLDVDGFVMLSSGWHVVNRLAHVVTQLPYEPDQVIEVYGAEDLAEWEARVARAERFGLDGPDELPDD